MSLIDQVTVLILTCDEAPNIRRTLQQLRWANRIIVVDSGSKDETLEIVSEYPQAIIVRRHFDTFADQCNFGLENISSEWVLSLDADYELSSTLVEELEQLAPPDDVAGYSAKFIYRIYGRPLTASLYPPRTVLYRRALARYQNEGHGHRVVITGSIRELRGPIYHDDRKALSRWFASQQKYAQQEAEYLLSLPQSKLNRVDKLRRMAWPAPVLVFLFTLLWKRAAFDGWPGWFYALQRTIAEMMIALAIVDRTLKASVPGTSAPVAQGLKKVND